jgi:protein-L-isoaspartate(D-aspartate) O-methyltransferase
VARPIRVLLLWPGTTGAAAGNFGVPQLVGLATYLRAKTGAAVTVVDLVAEAALGPLSIPKVLGGDDGGGYDVVALGCYSSYDHLKCLALAEAARSLRSDAVIVAGGYHASARPDDIVYDGSPYDVCIVGEAEAPMARVVESIAGGAPLRNVVLGSESVERLDDLPVTDWSYLARYRNVARKITSQTQLYLSRGCPFDCAFCMERAKRDVSWRAYSVERAVEEFRQLHRFLDLRTWTVYIADALFGMKTSWRRQFLEALARENLPARKLWLLIRVDLVDDEDLRLFAKANCGLGFGLESGDPGLLAIIRKAGRLDDYLDRMRHIAAVSRELDVPWGANVIVGHPGETPATLARSARYLRELFLDPKGTTGFLSVDPFRLYPGSPIDAERSRWEKTYGTRFHRPVWWHDGDQEFLSEWVDPSSELTYRERERLQHEHLAPILAEIPDRFVYRGPARDYFLRAATGQQATTANRWRFGYAERYYAWQRYLGRGSAGRAERRTDVGLEEVCRALRTEALPAVAQHLGVTDEAWGNGAMAPIREALEAVPRERFVPLDAVARSVRDVAVPLDTTGAATVSAMHAYARSYALLAPRPGDTVLDLGCGTGYGATLLARLVGESGRVYGVELDPRLAALARENVGSLPHVTIVAGDAADPSAWPVVGAARVVVGFALAEVPLAWAAALAPGAVVVAPVVDGDGQRLVRVTFLAEPVVEAFEPVFYVPQRSVAELPPPREARAQVSASVRRHLPLLT